MPKKYRAVESLGEINRSLETDSETEALARAVLVKSNLIAEWEARLAGREAPDAISTFKKTMGLARSRGFAYKPAEAIATGDLGEILKRIESLQGQPTSSAAVAAVLGGMDCPKILVSQMPDEMDRIHAQDNAARNERRQLREWRSKFIRACSTFVAAVGDKPVSQITVDDARKYRNHWVAKRERDSLTTDYINKQVGYMAKVVNSFFNDLGIEDFKNPFVGLGVEQSTREKWKPPTQRLEFPPSWIQEVLLDEAKTAGLFPDARDIAIICAECGTRAAEVFDLPEKHILLDEEVPHFLIHVESGGDQRRLVKNVSSMRAVPLIGHALEAMSRNPKGFLRYRGKARYSAYINKYFQDRSLFPTPKHTIKSLRHSFETRLKRAGVDSDERGQLMGHSIRKIRNREVYGAETDLRIRALYLEMIAFPTDRWAPRSHDVLREEISRLLEGEGFRTS